MEENIKKEVSSKSYTLYDERGNWLGQIVLTSDGMFASVTEYGNLSFAWRSFNKGDFRLFLCSLNIDYFGNKMMQGMSYIVHNKKCQEACKRFAEKILPALQKALKEELSLMSTPVTKTTP